MSVDVEHRLRVFFASAPQRTYLVETLEISHPAFAAPYYFWHETQPGNVTTEDGVRTFSTMNFDARRAGSSPNLDQIYEFFLDTSQSRVQSEFRAQMRSVALSDKRRVRIVFREYLSDDLTDMLTRAVLQLESVSYKLGVAVLTAVLPRLNMSRTGEVYAPRDIPMLRRFT